MVYRTMTWCIAAAVALSAFIGCGKKDNPASPPPTSTPRSIILRDSAIVDIGLYYYQFQLDLNDFTTVPMSIDTSVGNIYKGSIVSDSNSSALARTFPAFSDSLGTIGLEFYLMAKSSASTNFIAFLGKDGGSVKNSAWYVGMGFDKSDSVKYVYSTDLVRNQQNQDICPMQFNKWYKCRIEYSFATTTAKFYLDETEVGTHVFSAGTIFGYDMFVVYRDSAGAQGAAQYYLNDYTVYKK